MKTKYQPVEESQNQLIQNIITDHIYQQIAEKILDINGTIIQAYPVINKAKSPKGRSRIYLEASLQNEKGKTKIVSQKFYGRSPCLIIDSKALSLNIPEPSMVILSRNTKLIEIDDPRFDPDKIAQLAIDIIKTWHLNTQYETTTENIEDLIKMATNALK